MPESKIYLSSPHMGQRELELVKEAFSTNWISPVGPHIEGFEREIARYVEVDNCAALSSGTAAIHLALIILGVRRNDEVICSSFTFSGSCNPVAYLGAVPVFIDSETETWNMDPAWMEEAIRDRISKGRKPKAIIAVHLYGMPAQIERIMEIAVRYEIPVIEDAAEGLGSVCGGKKLGAFGDIGIFSFNGNKIITTSGGGAMVSRNGAWIQKAKFLSTQARDPAPHYQHSEIGYNYRLSNICAGIGLGQMAIIDERVSQRRSNFDYYIRELGHLPGIGFQPESQGNHSNRWLTCFTIDSNSSRSISRERIRLALEQHNIESRPLWKPMHLQPVFRDAPYYGTKTCEELFETGLCLPSGSNLSQEELVRVVTVVKHQFTQE